MSRAFQRPTVEWNEAGKRKVSDRWRRDAMIRTSTSNRPIPRCRSHRCCRLPSAGASRVLVCVLAQWFRCESLYQTGRRKLPVREYRDKGAYGRELHFIPRSGPMAGEHPVGNCVLGRSQIESRMLTSRYRKSKKSDSVYRPQW
jgi:hypothetical protein